MLFKKQDKYLEQVVKDEENLIDGIPKVILVIKISVETD